MAVHQKKPLWLFLSLRYMRVSLIVFLFTCLPFFGFSQDKPDTLLFNTGKVLVARVTDTSGDKITIEKPNSTKHKKIELDRSEVFSIRYGATGKEVVIYTYDTLTGNDFTIPEARMFIAGEQDAQKGFRAIGTSIGAFFIGTASGVTGASFFVLGPPFLYSGLMAYPRIRIPHRSVKNLENVKSDAYLYGYDNTARKKRVLRSLLWGGVGLVVGLTVHFTYPNLQ